MKHWKPIVSIVCAVVLVFCTGMFAACGDTAEYFTVTVAPYDGEKGSVEVSAPAKSKGYMKDEQVTLTVTPAQYCSVQEVKVNDAPVALTEGKYTFKVTGDTTVSATFEYGGWSNIVWHENTLGDLTFDEDYNMTLTPPGGEPQAVIITTEGVDLSEAFPTGEVEAIVVAGASVATYKISFGTFLVFKQGYTPYTFDSDPITDFSAYEGTWKQYGGDAQLVATKDGLTYGENAYSAYYTALDGSHYVKYRYTPLTKPQRYLFGYRDSSQSVLFFNMNNSVYHFTKDGALPAAAIPADFYGTWRNETYYDLRISADGATVNTSGEVSAFSVTGSGAEAVVHLYYNGLYWIMYQRVDAQTGEKSIVMDNGTTKNVFTAVKPEALPTEYRAEWTQLGGTDTVSVDGNGKFTYNGNVYETIRDSHNLGFHFTTEAGKDAMIEVSSDSYVLWIVTDTDAFYFTKAGATLPDLTAAGLSGTGTSGEKTLTAEGGHITVTDGAGAPQKVQILTWEQESGEEAGYIGTALYDNKWWDVKYVSASGTITFTSNHDLVLTFTLGS